jgi:hypothetical protein
MSEFSGDDDYLLRTLRQATLEQALTTNSSNMWHSMSGSLHQEAFNIYDQTVLTGLGMTVTDDRVRLIVGRFGVLN